MNTAGDASDNVTATTAAMTETTVSVSSKQAKELQRKLDRPPISVLTNFQYNDTDIISPLNTNSSLASATTKTATAPSATPRPPQPAALAPQPSEASKPPAKPSEPTGLDRQAKSLAEFFNGQVLDVDDNDVWNQRQTEQIKS